MKNPFATYGLSRDDAEAGLAYARWLHRKTFNDWMNKVRADAGLPTEQGPVCLNQRGKRVYEEIRKSGIKDGPVLLGDGERRAVVVALLERLEEIRIQRSSR